MNWDNGEFIMLRIKFVLFINVTFWTMIFELLCLINHCAKINHYKCYKSYQNLFYFPWNEVVFHSHFLNWPFNDPVSYCAYRHIWLLTLYPWLVMSSTHVHWCGDWHCPLSPTTVLLRHIQQLPPTNTHYNKHINNWNEGC